MKYSHHMKGMFAAILLIGMHPLKAGHISPMEVIGIAGKLAHWLNGETTVTPQTALHFWRLVDTVDYYGTKTRTYKKVTRDTITGHFFYVYQVKVDGVVTVENSHAFLIPWIGRQSFYCDTTGDGSAVYQSVQHFTVAASVAAVTKKGAFPPGAPYPGVAKSFGWNLPSDCNPVSGGRNYKEGFPLYDSGNTIFQFDTVDIEYAWPVLCWVGGFYDY